MPGLVSRLSVFIVIGSLLVGFAFNIVVVNSCEFFKGSTDKQNAGDNVGLGVFKFSVEDTNSTYDTSGECEKYTDWPEGQTVPGTIRTAQVCASLAPACGFLLLVLVVLNQCCCKVPCSGILQGIAHFVLHISMALVWLITRNDVCVSILFIYLYILLVL